MYDCIVYAGTVIGIYYVPSLAPHARGPVHRALTASRTRRGGPRPTAASGTQQQPLQSRAAVGACAPPRGSPVTTPGRGWHVEDVPSPRAAGQCASNRIKPDEWTAAAHGIISSTKYQVRATFLADVVLRCNCELTYEQNSRAQVYK